MDLIALSVTWDLFSTATIAATVSFIQRNALFATVNPPVVFIFAGCVGPILLSFMNHVLNFHKRSKSPCDFNVCGIEIDYGINYQCDYCDFIMHRQCLSLKPNIKYQAHQHDLLTLLQNNDKSYKSQCHACGFDIKSIFFVQCLECRLNFHVRCGSASASLPQVAQHKNHSHPLSLVTNESKALVKDDSILLYCNDCKEEIDPMAVLNQYNTHVRCVITETQLGERERYKHFSHRHLLVLLESKKSKCYACKRLNIQGKPAYGCDLCGFYLHQSCFELQKVIYLHQSHLHYLTLRDSSNSGKRVCKARGKHLNGLIYHCASCDFNLDLDCASQRPSMKKWKVWGDYESKYRV